MLNDLMCALYNTNITKSADLAVSINNKYYKCYFSSLDNKPYMRVYNYTIVPNNYYFEDLKILGDNIYHHKEDDILSFFLYLAPIDKYESMYHPLDPSNPNLIPFTLTNIAKLKMELG